MYCSKCGAVVEAGARFCQECGTVQEPSDAASAYAPPTDAAPQEPAYAPPVYEQPPAYPPQEPVYAPPVYEQPPAYPPQEQTYAPPVYEQPPAYPPQGPVYAPPVYDQPPAYPPQGAGYTQYPVAPPPVGSPPPPKKGGSKILTILIPVIAVVVILVTLLLLEIFHVIDIFPNWPASNTPPASTSDRDRDRDRDRDNEEDTSGENNTVTTPSPIIPSVPPFTTPAPSPVLPGLTIRGSGDSVFVDGETEYRFTPASSGSWTIFTSDRGSSDPYLELYNSRGVMIAYDDDGGDDSRNSRIVIDLNSGEEYTINAMFYGSGTGSYTLTVMPTPEIQVLSIPGPGGGARVMGATRYEFTPNSSGVWEIETSDCGGSDPYLEIYNTNGVMIDYDDDGGSGYNAMLILNLNAGETYIINARFYGSGTGEYTLTVRLGSDSANPGFAGTTIPGGGGQTHVSRETTYTFTPNETTLWVIFSTDNDGGDVDPIIDIADMYGNSRTDDDSGGNYNAVMAVYLEAGETFNITARFYGSAGSGYTLCVQPATMIGDTGGTFRADGVMGFAFMPGQSGTWEFRTANNGNSDPYLMLFDLSGNMLDSDDDGAGGLNSLITYNLDSSQAYFIFVRYYGGGTGACDLIVTRR